MTEIHDTPKISDALPVSHGRSGAVSREFEQAVKRMIDISLAVGLIFLLVPLLVLVAVFIRSSDGGPALFRQRRIGQGGKPFECFKFRSMVTDADSVLKRHLHENLDAAHEWREKQKLSRDPRVTSFGRFLRKSSLDELPQLFNILRGDMSFVGPRPILEEEIPRYGDAFGHCFTVPPGLTGLWQVSGRSDCSYVTRVALDSRYVSDWSLALDLTIMIQTVPAVLRQHGSV